MKTYFDPDRDRELRAQAKADGRRSRYFGTTIPDDAELPANAKTLNHGRPQRWRK